MAAAAHLTDWFRFQFVHQPDLASDLIALAGAGDFSHVDIVLDNGFLLGARMDSVGGAPPGVQIRPPDYVASWNRQVVIAAPCTPEQKAAAMSFAIKQIGRGYDKLAIVAFVTGASWRENGEWFCSEFGEVAGETGGLWAKPYSPPNKINPVELANIASSVPGRTITVLK